MRRRRKTFLAVAGLVAVAAAIFFGRAPSPGRADSSGWHGKVTLSISDKEECCNGGTATISIENSYVISSSGAVSVSASYFVDSVWKVGPDAIGCQESEDRDQG